MTDDRSRETSADPPGRSYLLVGLVLLGIVVVLLVGAFILDKQFRPRVGIEPAVSTAPTTERAADHKATVQPASVPTTAAAVVPSSTTAPAGQQEPTPPLERQVEDAYLRYWEVLREAYLNTDTSRLREVTAGAELSRQEQEIRSLKAKGRAAKLDVDHRIALVEVTPERAIVYDEYLNRSVFVDPVTKQELPTKETPETEKISFDIRKFDGVWKVVNGTRHN